MASRYQQDNAAPLWGTLVMTVIGAGGGGVLGYGLGYVGHATRLVFVWPALMGLGAGAGVVLGIVAGQVRSARVVAAAAAFAGACSVLADHHMSYLMAQQGVVEAGAKGTLLGNGQLLTKQQSLQRFDDYIFGETRFHGVVGYVLWDISQGMKVKNELSGVAEHGAKATLVFHLLDVLVAAAAALMITQVYKREQAPFCSQCNAWLTSTTRWFVDFPAWAVEASLKKSQMRDAGASACGPSSRGPAACELLTCVHCDAADRVLLLQRVTYAANGHPTRHEYAQFRLPMMEAETLMAAAREAMAAKAG